MVNARAAYNTLCRALDECELKYTKKEDDLVILLSARGDDLPVDILFRVDNEREVVTLFSNMPFKINEKKRVEAAVAVSYVNNLLVDGSFDLDVLQGNLYYRMTVSYKDSLISSEVYSYMVYCAFAIIDEYNDKFMMLSKGIIDVEKFIELSKK